ncbi:MAG: transcription-repair coupling factor [Dehalococcoidia bacterium]
MNLAGLHPIIYEHSDFRRLVESLGAQEQELLIGDAARPLLLACLIENTGLPVLAVTPHVETAKKLEEDLKAYCRSGTQVLRFTEIDVLPYERLTPDYISSRSRLTVLAALHKWRESASGRPPLIVASIHALCQKTVSPEDFAGACRMIKQGLRLEIGDILGRLSSLGYEMTEMVEVAGEMSRRGGIVDIYPPDCDFPARIEFYGNEVESIRWFDPATQRSLGTTDSILIVPAREMILSREDLIAGPFGELDLSNCGREARDWIYEDINLMRDGHWRVGLDFYAPLFNQCSLIDHLPGGSLLAINDRDTAFEEMTDLESRAAEIRRDKVERGELPINFPSPFFSREEMEERISSVDRVISFNAWGVGGTGLFGGLSSPPDYSGRMPRLLRDTKVYLKEGRRIVMISQQAERLAELFGEQDIHASPVTELSSLPPAGSLTIVFGSISAGWTFENNTLLTDSEIFGTVKKRRPRPGRRGQRELFLADLSAGDYVVHIDHGVGRFLGMTRMKSDGAEREYLVLEYADEGKLYVPTDQADRVARYVGSGGYEPSLNKLHTREWSRTRERVKKATMEMARELLSLYAARQVSPGIAFSADTLWESELEASFPYEETPDQKETIRDVKKDMLSRLPMDRLVCGDVGYGKTEIAVRAAFKAVNNGMQVAVLVPTTVLAQQHFATFKERLAAFPVRIEMLSRFRSPGEQREVLEALAGGDVDICIGTHRLVQSDVVFRNLGLVVIDEEQKFGVAHKERLKKLRSEVDVLTLSATPIPRSLHMSLLGVRDMSTIETAPAARLPIKTNVAEYSDEKVREAVLREIDRGGQVFFVHNRVQSIDMIADHLRALVPEARIAVAHGQMPEHKLESVMVEFMRGDYDVLVCTTIIESGLDLPGVNTLIVNRADRFGLTQLYHLRGRVGRGDARAYAYLFYDRGKRLTETAKKRLKTIFEATELGAGFRIAMKDLEIRGAGNILGPEQSGHVGAVGFDMYCRLLAEAVEELKMGGEGKARARDLPTVDLPLSAHLPEDYVPDLNARLAVYQRLARIDHIEQVNEMRGELKDRFGNLPWPVENLLYGIKIKLAAATAGIQRIFTEYGKVILVLETGANVDMAYLRKSFGTSIKAGSTRVSLDIRQLGKSWPGVLEQVVRIIAARDRAGG